MLSHRAQSFHVAFWAGAVTFHLTTSDANWDTLDELKTSTFARELGDVLYLFGTIIVLCGMFMHAEMPSHRRF
tara:strand:- start:490 stop:708 length:219 start_codon:yes stop_codon:yes gene_type:complete